MGKTQSYIHLKPFNLLPRDSKKLDFKYLDSKTGTVTQQIINSAPYMLKIHLTKFPSFIGHTSSRINRLYNEDSYSINMLKLPTISEEMNLIKSKGLKNNCNNLLEKTPRNKSVLNLSIFDGHGGDRVSKMLANELHKSIVNTLPVKSLFNLLLKNYEELVGGKYWAHLYSKRDEYYEKFIKNCNTKDEQILLEEDNLHSGSRMIFDKWGNIFDKTSLLSEQERLRIFLAYMKFDLEDVCGFRSTIKDDDESLKTFAGGSTASSIFLTSYDESDSYDESFFVNPDSLLKLVVTQVGDTKIILCDKNGIAHSLAKVHHPHSSREFRRLGGHFQTDSFGDMRFLNTFSNTRSFGDRMGKRDGLSCEPDIYSYLVGPTRFLPRAEHSKLQFGGDECFICLITDGISNLMGDQELVDLITTTVNNRGLKVATPQYCSEELIQYIMAIGGKHADNATCLILRFPNWGNWPVIDRTGAIREEKLLSGSTNNGR